MFIFVVVLGIAFIGISVFGSLLAFYTEALMVDYVIAAIVVLLLSGVYFSLLPHFSSTSKTLATTISIGIAIIYTVAIVCAFVALFAGILLLQKVVAVATALNFIATIVFILFML